MAQLDYHNHNRTRCLLLNLNSSAPAPVTRKLPYTIFPPNFSNSINFTMQLIHYACGGCYSIVSCKVVKEILAYVCLQAVICIKNSILLYFCFPSVFNFRFRLNGTFSDLKVTQKHYNLK